MRRLSLVLGSSLGVLAFVAATGTAEAQQPAPAPAGAAPAAAPAPKEEADEHKSFLIVLNPLAIGIGRYSIQAEYLPATHHAITLNPFFASVPVTATVNGKEVDLGSLTGFGAELGYRYYTGTKGPNGFFIGPSLLFGAYSTDGGGTNAQSKSFTGIGGALDLGGQAVIGPGFTIGGGFGMQYTSVSEDFTTDDFNLAGAIIAGGGLRPRFLFAIGWAF